jgi:MFS family permease
MTVHGIKQVGGRGQALTNSKTDAVGQTDQDAMKKEVFAISDMLHRFSLLLKCPREIRIVFMMKLLEATAYFLFAVVLVSLLSSEFGMSDRTAGWLYGCYGTTVSILGLFMGFVIDNIGVRWTLLLAGVLLVASRAIITFTSASWLATVTLLTTASVGQALVNPVLAMALRRYTDEDVRQFAFSLFYVMQNLAYAAGAFLIHGVRYAHGAAEWHLSMYRVVLLCGVFCTFAELGFACMVREIRACKDGSVETFIPRTSSGYNISKEVLGQPRFWRFLAISVLFLGVMMNFHHMNVTFPKYFVRQFGENAPFELVLAINPIVIVFLVPAVTYAIDLLRLDYGTVLVVGSLISGVSPFALAVLNSTQGAIVWMVMLSLGEAIWSPKLMEMSVAVAPEGREGTYMSLTSAPLLISKLGVGGLSGALLTQFCPEEGDCHGSMMWTVIGCTTCPLTLVLLLLRARLFVAEDWAVGTPHESPALLQKEASAGGKGPEYGAC